MARTALLVVLGVGAVTAAIVARQATASTEAADQAPGIKWDLFGGVMGWVEDLRQDTSTNRARYLDAVIASEARHGLPAGLLDRLLYQESRYRTDIIDGTTRSPTGALGIAQFMPATAAELGVDPLDPYSAIDGAARYLAQQFQKFGDWRLALAAYNAGPGNVRKYNGVPPFAETQRYVAQIAADVGLA